MDQKIENLVKRIGNTWTDRDVDDFASHLFKERPWKAQQLYASLRAQINPLGGKGAETKT